MANTLLAAFETNSKRSYLSDQEDENSGKKIYIVDGAIELRFAVAATSPLEAEQEARRRITKSLENEVFGTAVGWTFTAKRVQEAKPIQR